MNVYLFIKEEDTIYKRNDKATFDFFTNDVVKTGLVLVYSRISKATQLSILEGFDDIKINLKFIKEDIDIENISEKKKDDLTQIINSNINNNYLYDISNISKDFKYGNIEITDTSEYINIINHVIDNDQFLFRGQLDDTWGLRPSVYRENYTDDKEFKIYKELRKNNFKEFPLNQAFVEELVNMQHMGIPTRLLDWSSNPLTALFFAISSNNKDDDRKTAKVFMHKPEQIYNFNDDMYLTLSNLFKSEFNNRPIDDTEVIRLLKNMIYENIHNYFFIETIYQNARIRAQQGYFSIMVDIKSHYIKLARKYIIQSTRIAKYLPVNLVNKLIDVNLRGRSVDDVKNDFITFIKMGTTLKELGKVGKTETYIKWFMDDLKKSKYFDVEYDPNSEFEIKLKDNVIEFVIHSEFKKKIRQQLNVLGINSATIYPDLEGFAQHIKDKYERKVIL